MDELGDKQVRIIKDYFARQTEVISCYLFGSRARGKASDYSDVDIAVLLDSKVPSESYTDLKVHFSLELSKLLSCESDVVILNQSPLFLQYEVFKEQKMILEKNLFVNRAYRANAILEYLDFRFLKDALESRIIDNIRRRAGG